MVIDLTAQLVPVFWGMMLLTIASAAGIATQAVPMARAWRPKKQLQPSAQLAHAKSAI